MDTKVPLRVQHVRWMRMIPARVLCGERAVNLSKRSAFAGTTSRQRQDAL
jgi:hypothetical protein